MITIPPPRPVREPRKPATTEPPARIPDKAQLSITPLPKPRTPRGTGFKYSRKPAQGEPLTRPSFPSHRFMLLLPGSVGMLDTDIEGLDPQQATQYVLAFITTLKQTEKALADSVEDENLWTRRVTLARSKGDEGLAAQAQARLSDATTKRSQLEVELSDLRAKVAVLKEKLNRLRMTGGRIVDTDLLLAQLQMLVAPRDELAATMKKEEASAALDELKKKMRDTGGR